MPNSIVRALSAGDEMMAKTADTLQANLVDQDATRQMIEATKSAITQSRKLLRKLQDDLAGQPRE